ncbi:uncharacterized protein LOC127253189 [Andrographis paniculata]|uniref:uncharacterized protein LOC127253189 n=1 Tax=Andrographis paniculata TaxID=175694 RepID=UPI0021E7056F|nr:uncharacterized protein LOC127253189 [Andrographis paniculata]
MYMRERENRGERKRTMGQIVKRSKKGRPPKADPGGKGRRKPPANDLRRSLRRRNVKYVFDLDDYFDEDELFAGDEEQRRREKKLKHLLKSQAGGDVESTPQPEGRARRVDHAPESSHSSDIDGRCGKPSKTRKVDLDDMDEYVDDENDETAIDGDGFDYQDHEEVRRRKSEPKIEDSRQEMAMEVRLTSGLRLPDKKVLELILDKLQKKDMYGVYAEPVDPEELPDYHDVIEHPMDFSTVRSKLRNGSYANFDQFESDVFLICSNAMQYNAPDTIYYKQARSIQELAKRKFQKIRSTSDRMEEIKDAQRTSSGSNSKKQIRRPVSRTAQELGSDFSYGATLATAGDMQTQNGRNTLQTVGAEKLVGTDGHVEGNSFLNHNSIDKAEESLSGKGSLPRLGRKPSIPDENRRATYSLFSNEEDSAECIFSTFEGKTKQLVPVGLYSDHSYARSLAHFAASLGSVAWRVASKRIEQAVPQGFKFGRGWVGEYEPLSTPVLIFENCTVKEPPYFAEVPAPADSNKSRTNPTFSDPKFPFCGASRFGPPQVSVDKDQPIITNNLETRTPFFLAPEVKQSGFPNVSGLRQKLQPVNEHPSKNINFSKSGSFKQPDSNGVSADLAKEASDYPEQRSSKQSSAEAPVLPLAPSPSNNDSGNAAALAARAWMSVGAGGFKPGAEIPNPNKNQIYADSLYNSTRDVVQLDRNGSPIQPFVRQEQVAMMGGNVIPFPNQRSGFPQLSAADLSQLQLQSTWRNLSPRMLNPPFISRQKQESRPPDLNIGFQSSGSPAKLSSGVLVDSQQPDLALQL